jgi:hypothetical protein
MNTSYTDILSCDMNDLYPELSEEFYTISLTPKSVLRVLDVLFSNNEYEIHDEILDFLCDEYSEDFKILFPQKNVPNF